MIRTRGRERGELDLLTCAAAGSAAGAALGSWLMHKKLDANRVKKIIGIALYGIAAKMAWGCWNSSRSEGNMKNML